MRKYFFLTRFLTLTYNLLDNQFGFLIREAILMRFYYLTKQFRRVLFLTGKITIEARAELNLRIYNFRNLFCGCEITTH